ncbi:MAG: hypothetical protein MZU95_01640 [Desulfomicrobium escambiense]|nr:hypothetical protein [Desulfomicrobium escambiense]
MDIFVYLGPADPQGRACWPSRPIYHNAVLFSRYFRFCNPEQGGRGPGHPPDLQPHAHQAAGLGRPSGLPARRADGSVYEWTAEEQVYPLTPGPQGLLRFADLPGPGPRGGPKGVRFLRRLGAEFEQADRGRFRPHLTGPARNLL